MQRYFKGLFGLVKMFGVFLFCSA